MQTETSYTILHFTGCTPNKRETRKICLVKRKIFMSRFRCELCVVMFVYIISHTSNSILTIFSRLILNVELFYLHNVLKKILLNQLNWKQVGRCFVVTFHVSIAVIHLRPSQLILGFYEQNLLARRLVSLLS